MYDMHIFVNDEREVLPIESCRYDIHICADRAFFFSNKRSIIEKPDLLVENSRSVSRRS